MPSPREGVFGINISQKTEAILQRVFEKHLQMGHTDMATIFKILNLTNEQLLKAARYMCASCWVGKLPNTSQKAVSIPKAHRVNFRIFMDTCGPFIVSYFHKFLHFLFVIDEKSGFSDVIFLKKRSEFTEEAKFWIANANAIHTPNIIAELRIDGAPEYNSKSISDWYKTQFLKKLTGLPYAHTHQYKAERGLRNVQELDRAMRDYANLGPEFWPFGTKQANNIRNVLPKMGSKSDITPFESYVLRGETRSLKELHAHILPIGAEIVYHRPKETRLKTRGDMPGERGLYLCSNGPNKGHMVLRLRDRRVLDNIKVVRVVAGSFPLRIARENDMNTIYENLSFKQPTLKQTSDPNLGYDAKDLIASEVEETTESKQGGEDEVDSDSNETPVLIDDPPTSQSRGINASMLMQEDNKIVPIAQVDKRLARLNARLSKKEQVTVESLSEAPQISKPLEEVELKVGDYRMTTHGKVRIAKVHDDGDLRVCWPNSSEPESFYTVSSSDVWSINDHPNDCFDDKGNSIPIESVNSYKGSPNSIQPYTHIGESVFALNDRSLRDRLGLRSDQPLVGNALADDVELALPRTRRQEEWCTDVELLKLVTNAKTKEWQTLRNKGCYSELIELPPGKAALRHVWILKAKADKKGFLVRVKGRCALQGNREKHDVPKLDAYAPVMYIYTLRVMLAYFINDPEVRFFELDITCAYISANMKREVYVYDPDEFRSKSRPHFVRRVLKALYGGIDSGRCYYEHWVSFHIGLGFQPIHHDKCYMQYVTSNGFIRFCFHVDDSTIAQKGDALWEWYLKKLSKEFEYTVGPLQYCLGIAFHVDYDKGTIDMEQTAKIEHSLRVMEFDKDMKSATTPSPVGGKDPTEEGMIYHTAEDQASGKCFPMLRALGLLNHLHCSTRPCIGRALRVASRSGYNFSEQHVKYVKHIFRYLKGTKNLCLSFRRQQGPLALQIFTDASHAGCLITRRSMSGLVAKLCGNTVFWKVSFQGIVSHSSTESELMALDKGATTGQFLKWICVAIGASVQMPIPIFVDNTATISMGVNPIQPGRNLHIHARYYYVRDMVAMKEYNLYHLRTDEQVSDVLVTFKSSQTFLRLRTLLVNCAYVFENEHGQFEWYRKRS